MAAAKKEVFGDVGIEGMTAGPSEVTVVCDKFSNPEWVATHSGFENLSQTTVTSEGPAVIPSIPTSPKTSFLAAAT